MLYLIRVFLPHLFSLIFLYNPGFIRAQSLELADTSVVFRPLDILTVRSTAPGMLSVVDAAGRVYYEQAISAELAFPAGGALGAQQLLLKDGNGKLIDQITVRVDGKTGIRDAGSRYERLLDVLYHSMVGEWGKEADVVFVDGKFYRFFVRWLRDHVHTLKGMKYFYPELKSGIDLYADYQREDGMIWDNIQTRNYEKNWWDKRFRYGDFIREADGGRFELKRIPVENDVEYLFIEGLYYTWKATGDDEWMKGHLNKALKALAYSQNSPYRWSEKYRLLKRGFTIDTWDFQATEDAERVGGDIMVVKLDTTRFGIMFGDNTGMANACVYLAEMLRYAGRKQEAEEVEATGRTLQRRIDELAWTGEYYLHHVPEDPSVERDLGVDQSKQVSLSNAYSLNRQLTHEQAAAIIRTYQRIREEMPESSPGEWYAIYPPFERGFGEKDNSQKWEYMNGGVLSIVAGELAHGAFEHGFESYGVDILDRVLALAEENDGYLNCEFRGAMPETPERRFTTLDLGPVANAVFPAREAEQDGQPFAKKDQKEPLFHDIPFQASDPAGGEQAIQVSAAAPEVQLPFGQKAASLYLLHQLSPGGSTPMLVLHYADGSRHTDYITAEKAGNWWIKPVQPKKRDICRQAWRSNNENHYVALYVYGLNNPHPEKEIETIEFRGTLDGRTWSVAGVTLSDAPVFFMPDRISYGIPDNWGAAAVVYALVEGLAGVVDAGAAFDRLHLQPRWTAAGVDEVEVMVKYPASGGYAAYKMQEEEDGIHLTFTGSMEESEVRLLLPEGKTVKNVRVNGRSAPVQMEQVEDSRYAVLEAEGAGIFKLELELRER